MFEQLTAFYNIHLGDVSIPGFGWTLRLEIGKLIGYLGAFLFTGRWFIQAYASKNAGKPVLPRVFWYMSFFGSLFSLSYFVFGRNDSVGILNNLFPVILAGYNLFLDITHHSKQNAAS